MTQHNEPEGIRLVGSQPSPQIALGGVPRLARPISGALRFEAELEVLGAPLVNPAIHADLGSGFGDEWSAKLTWRDGKLVAPIPDIAPVRSLRFDPGEGPCDIRLGRLRLVDGTDEEKPLAAAGPRLEGVALSGVRLVSVRGLIKDEAEADVFIAPDEDPHLIFATEPAGGERAALVRYEFDVEALEGSLGAPRVYLDYGGGYSNRGSFVLSPDGDGGYVAFVAGARLPHRVRWDPSDRAGRIRIRSVLARSITPDDLPDFMRAKARRAVEGGGRRAAMALTVDLNAIHRRANLGPGAEGELPRGALARGRRFLAALAGYQSPSDYLAAQLSRRIALSGARIVGAGLLEVEEEGDIFTVLGDDPYVIFTTQMKAAASPLAWYAFDVEEFDSSLGAPRIYLDYGAGFTQEASFPLDRQADGGYLAVVAGTSLAHRVRWDPSDRAGRIRIRGVTVKSEPPNGLLPQAVVQDLLTARPADGREAAALSIRLNADYVNVGASIGYDYGRWLERNEAGARDEAGKRELLERLTVRPRFSFVTPTYNTPPELLEACIRSMQAQVYEDFEICIADDASTDGRVRETLRRLAAEDDRIKLRLRRSNGHISEASNAALSLATGEYVVLVDHDDLVPDYCLLTAAAYLQAHPQAKVLYSDEDKIDPEGRRRDPYFKSRFNPFLMYGHNMVSHLGVYERALVKKVGGFRKGYEGSQDYDLFLRCLSVCGEAAVVHMPHVLYHWRMLPGSTAVSADQKSYAVIAAQRSLNDHFAREGLPFRSVEGVAPGLTGLALAGPAAATTVSIVIPTRDRVELLRACMTSLEGRIDENVEVVVVDNGTEEAQARAYLDELAGRERVTVVAAPGGFNFSALCNAGVARAQGQIICLLNNDTEVVSDDWLARARALLSLPRVGVVGARLVYPDGTLQHFGLYLGMGDHGVAGTPHRGIEAESFGYFGKARLIQEFSAVTAACLFVRRSDYLAVGGFDEGLAVAYNDVDFCLKIGARGLKVVGDPDILLVHKESKSRGDDRRGDRARRLRDEARAVRERWAQVLADDPFYNPNLTLERDDFSLAATPRTPFPWQRQAPSDPAA